MKNKFIKLFIGVFLTLSIASCGGKPATVNYVSQYYFETDSGSFEHKSEHDVTKEGTVGETVTIEIKSFESYYFDNENPNNVTTLELKEGENILSAYYKKLAPTTAEYVVRHYFENDEGDFIHKSEFDVTGTGVIGETVSATIKSFDNYIFDIENPNNVITITLAKENNILSLYYKQVPPEPEVASYRVQYFFENNSGEFVHNAEYDVTGEGEVGDEVRAEIKTFMGYTFDSTNPNNVLVINLVKGDNLLAVYYKKINEDVGEIKYINGDSFDISTSLSISDTTKGGIKFLENSSDLNPKIDGNDAYYEITLEDGKASFELVDINGRHLIDSKDNAFEEGDVKLNISLEKDEGVYSLSIDETLVLEVSDDTIASKGVTPINSWGAISAYENDGVKQTLKPITISSGELNFAGIKEKVIAGIFSTEKYKNNLFDSVTFGFNYDIIDLDVSTVGGCMADYAAIRSALEAATTIDTLFAACVGTYALRLRAFKEYTDYCLNETLRKIHYSFFMPYCETAQTLSEGVAPVLFANYKESDLRYYVPNAYKLRTWDPTSPGLLDMFYDELNTCASIKSAYALSDKYTTDCVRALAYHDAEYYYWQEYNLHNKDTYNMWWFLYTYIGAAGDGFKYYGKVFGPTYTWTNDYRLSNFFYDPDLPSGADSNEMILGGLATMLSLQTVANRAYTLTLNTCGGTLAKTEIVTDSSQTINLGSPDYIPVKEGYTFAGWYASRVFKGDPVTSIPAGNLNSLTLYACWKEEGDVVEPSVVPASFITENQVFQRGKPIVISGTGTDGVEVSVDFNNTNKTTTIVDGKWKVSFEPLEASFDAKTLTISGDGNNYVFHNILIGDVWLCGGQSNMEYQICWLNGWGVDKVGEFGELHNFDKIRIFRQYVSGDTASEASADNMQCDRWYIGNSVNDFLTCCAIGVVFANRLAEALDCPIGIINSNRGGSVIEEWLSAESLAICGSSLPDNELKNPESRDSRFYETMMSKFVGADLSIKGVLWYQGESNSYNTDIYQGQFEQLVKQYREIFNDQNLPVICQQLVQYSWIDYVNMRNVQWSCMEEIENVYCSCGIDTGNVLGGPDEIHAPEKIIIGTRMAAIALEKVYGIGEDSIAYYPVSATKTGNKVIVTFEDGVTITGSAAQFFQIKDTDGQLHDIQGVVVGNTIEFTFNGEAASVLYAQFTYLGYVSLFGGNGLPIAPFVIEITK